MYQNKKYGRLVFYLESCQSGSMFDGFVKPDMNIWAVSAAQPDEDSYACSYDPILKTYLNDCWSARWLENSKRIRVQMESLEYQFNLISNHTPTSHPVQYGSLYMANLTVAIFMMNVTNVEYPDQFDVDPIDMMEPMFPTNPYLSVGSRDVELLIATLSGNQPMIDREIDSRNKYDELFSDCVLDQPIDLTTMRIDQQVYQQLVADHIKNYGPFSDYGLKYTKCLALKSIV